MSVVESQRFKTKLCHDFQKSGSCARGSNCLFAHGEQELKHTEINENSIKRPELFKTQLCKRFTMQGFCSTGDDCAFAHGRHELRPKGMSNEEFQGKITANPLYKTQLCSRYESGGYTACSNECEFAHGDNELRTLQPDKISFKPSKQLKTEMCKHFMKGGHCAMSDRCTFAHGPHELRTQSLDERLRYKTVMCKNFEANGDCDRKENCSFAHGPEELRTFEDNSKYFVAASGPSAPPSTVGASAIPAFNDPSLTYEAFLIHESGDPNMQPPASYKRYLAHLSTLSAKRSFASLGNGTLSLQHGGPPLPKRPLY